MAKIKNEVKKETTIDKMWKEHSDFMLDSMWMSYRYCIGRHTIASHSRAGDIGKYCYGHLSEERSIFNAYDINREIEQQLQFSRGVSWYFPITSLNRIYTSAIDILCEFLEDYDIKSKEEYLKYYEIHVILADNERGYKLETTTWEEKLQSLSNVFKELYDRESTEEIVALIKELQKKSTDDVDSRIRWIVRSYPNPDYFYFCDIEDLFVWNDLVHLFDIEHHYKVELIDGTIEEVFDTWKHKYELGDDGFYRKVFGYEKVVVPVKDWNGINGIYIPKENIKQVIE